MLADAAKLAERAAKKKTGVGAFNVILLEQAEGFIAAAEQTGLPVILQLSQNAVSYHRGHLAPLAKALLSLAELSSAQISVHLDHAESLDLCREAIDLGFTSIMYDGSKLPDAENWQATAAITKVAHAQGVSVEAELGEVGGKNGVHDPSARTNPEDAARFVAETGIDLLAVAVGSSHAMASRTAVLDNALISAIHELSPVPLVLHGSSGVDDAGMQAAIASGMTKINVSTHLNTVFTHEVRKVLATDAKITDPRKYVRPGIEQMEKEAARLLRLYSLD